MAACSQGTQRDTPPPDPVRAPDTTSPLAGTAWQLIEFRGGDDTRLTPDDPSTYTIEFKHDGTLIARFDCNRGRGTWKASGSSLEFGPMALTRAMCPPESLHDRMVKHWPYVRSYLIRDGNLYLSLMADGGIYEFEPAAGASPEPGPGAMLEGTASYRERTALPPEAMFEAQLEDVSRADAPAEMMGKTSLGSPGNPPIHFAIPYDPARIQADRSYVVRARILVGEEVFFTTDQAYPVLTRGSPDTVSLMLRRAAATPDVTVEETYWKLSALGAEASVVRDNMPEPHLLLHAADKRASGSTGCNRFSGGYELNGESLRFQPLASTLMACVDGDLSRQERAFLDALGATRSWKVTGDTLVLSGKSGPLARFGAVYLRF